MYVVEKFSWSSLTESEERRAEADEMMAESDKATRERLAATAKPGDDDQLPLDEAASACPTDANSLYAFTENYVEVRAAFQEDKRGLITFGFLSLALVLNAYFGFVFVYSPFNFLIFGTPYVEPWDLGMFFFGVFTSTIWFAINYFFGNTAGLGSEPSFSLIATWWLDLIEKPAKSISIDPLTQVV